MRGIVLTLALVPLFVASVASAQERKEVRPTVDAPRVGETAEIRIPDRDIAPIARAIRRGEPASRIETNWKALLERHADGLEENDANTLTLRVLHAAWEPMEPDLDDGFRDLEASDACADETRAIDRHRNALKRALTAGDAATGRDVEAATASFAALSEALEACSETLAAGHSTNGRKIVEPAGAARAPREPEKAARPAPQASVRAGIVPADGGDDAAGDDAAGDDTLDDLGDDGELSIFRLQNWLEKQQQTLRMLSNISKASHETAKAIIRNMK